mmetsp:Transcript_47852/g.107832  ORF Transcript_47852/g.107832 Transcript_47852/m.107832 type:complete len:254 (+) Transcript_47852:314-1075(+)
MSLPAPRLCVHFCLLPGLRSSNLGWTAATTPAALWRMPSLLSPPLREVRLTTLSGSARAAAAVRAAAATTMQPATQVAMRVVRAAVVAAAPRPPMCVGGDSQLRARLGWLTRRDAPRMRRGVSVWRRRHCWRRAMIRTAGAMRLDGLRQARTMGTGLEAWRRRCRAGGPRRLRPRRGRVRRRPQRRKRVGGAGRKSLRGSKLRRCEHARRGNELPRLRWRRSHSVSLCNAAKTCARRVSGTWPLGRRWRPGRR